MNTNVPCVVEGTGFLRLPPFAAGFLSGVNAGNGFRENVHLQRAYAAQSDFTKNTVSL